MIINDKLIYISYSEPDDVPVKSGERGWVSSFKRFLEILLTQISGEKPEIKTSEDSISKEEFDKIQVFIPVLSVEYLKSKRIEELNAFINNCKEKSTLLFNGKPRVLKVLKTLIPTDVQPQTVREFPNYDLFQFNIITGDTVELNQFFGPEAERNYWMKLVDLSYDIAGLLGVEVAIDEQRFENINDDSESVYLAATGRELSIHRDIIKRELIRHGHRVLPDQLLNPTMPGLEQTIKKAMEKCKLSIHLIGESYADAALETSTSVMAVENKIAAERCEELYKNKEKEKGDFTRLIWISPEIRETNERQRLFLENLRRDAEAISGADILQTTLEDLKTIIRTELVNSTNKVTSNQKHTEQGKKSIYLVIDPQDMDQSLPLREYLKSEGFNVILPEYHSNLMKTRLIHQDLLKICDSTLVFFGLVSEQWVKSKIQDILKAPGFGRTKPLQCKGVFLYNRGEIKDNYYAMNGITVLYNNENKFKEAVQPFVQKLLNS